jgi:hypothetical protein
VDFLRGLIDCQPVAIGPNDPSFLHVDVSAFEGDEHVVGSFQRGLTFLRVKPLREAFMEIPLAGSWLFHFSAAPSWLLLDSWSTVSARWPSLSTFLPIS